MSREESIGSKLKSLFTKPKRPNQAASSTAEDRKPLVISAEHIQDISKGTPANNREKKILELTPLVERQRLEPTAPGALTAAVKDLLAHNDKSKRHTALHFIHAIIKGQDEELGMLREYFFHLIGRHRIHDDQPICLDILNTLTKGGQNLLYIDQQIGSLLVQWLNDYTLSDKKTDFLELLVNVIKFNSAFIDEDKAMELFKLSCSICNKTTSEEEIRWCLSVLESVIKYYYVKSAALLPFCMTLSRTVLTETFVQRSWKLMKELLGTHLGYSALFTLTNILQNSNNLMDASLLRGAIFFIGMALWGSQRVDTVQVSATAVLPSFKCALMCNNSKVAFEVSTTVLRLVRKFGKSQPSILWDNVLDILDHLHELIKTASVGESAIINKISNNVHDILTAMEDLQDNCTYSSSPDRLFMFIEMCAASRPESSVTMLLEHRAESCRPNTDTWLDNLEHLLTKYYKTETRPTIRLKALSVLEQIISTNKVLHEEELLELMLTTFSAVYTDPDVTVRCFSVRMLVEQAKTCSTRKCVEILALIHKIVEREMKPNLISTARNADTESQCADILDAVSGLLDIFKSKLYELRGSHTILPLDIITSHIRTHYTHYTKYKWSPTARLIRRHVFSMLLDLRVDWSGKVGLEGSGYSSYLYISDSYVPESHTESTSEDNPNTSRDVKILDFDVILNLINTCLKMEIDWKVLGLVLTKMPPQWQNKRLILSAQNSTIDAICQQLCNMLKEKKLRELIHDPTTQTKRFNKSDFDEQIIPVLTCMSAYHKSLHVAKSDMIRCLEFGLVTRRARICVHTLRVCCMEMESIMLKMLPKILTTLSQIRANKDMALPLLMFLSCLVRLPRLYRNFNEGQYKFIFAIALPYTDPSQFQHFAVYLAYHVIVMWFVKCRLMYRKQFVPFVIKGLQSHNKAGRGSSEEAEVERKLHQELEETCVDIMSRYTFSNCASVPKRTPVTDFLLEGGRSQTWFVGNKLITITTSGGSAKVTKTGLCHRCTASVRGNNAPPPTHTEASAKEGRKRHRSAFVNTPSSSKEAPDTPFTQDDMIHNPSRINTISESAESNGSGGPVEPNEDLFAALASSGDKYTLGECNCWCNGWAEIYVYRPSGDTSWILRIQNRQLFNYEEFPLSDISSLFRASPHKSPFPSRDVVSGLPVEKMIESGSLEEKEYVEQHDRYFNPEIALNSTARRKISLQCTDEDGDVSVPPVPDHTSLHRTVSSPVRNHSNPDMTSRATARSPSADSDPQVYPHTLSPLVGSGSHHLHPVPHQSSPPITGSQSATALRAHSQSINVTNTGRHSMSPAPTRQTLGLGGSSSAFTRQTSLTDLENTDTYDGAPPISSVSFTSMIHEHIIMEDETLDTYSEEDHYDGVNIPFTADQTDIVPMMKPRSQTFSVSSTSASPDRLPVTSKRLNTHTTKDMRTGILPSFVFLQLYHMNALHSSDIPIPIPEANEDFNRALKNLNRMAPYETHKVGIVYVGKGQATDELAILSNTYGSKRYSQFLKGLGTLLSLNNCDPRDMHIGGLDHEEGQDGKYTYTWHDEVVQMVFHIATMMPTKEKDPKCNDKKRHIGNDYVTIVYNDSGEKYNMGTIKGAFNYVNIVIEPLDQVSNAVSVLCKDEIQQIMEHVSTRVISDEHVTNLVKQIALHSSMASLVCERSKNKVYYASNWLERLRQIKRMKDKIMAARQHSESDPAATSHTVSDFTEYML